MVNASKQFMHYNKHMSVFILLGILMSNPDSISSESDAKYSG
jgi:hypothetical protein